jgi:hypothetical protein
MAFAVIDLAVSGIGRLEVAHWMSQSLEFFVSFAVFVVIAL